MPLYVERLYCDKCLTEHWVEVYRAGTGEWKERCHGKDLSLETEKTFAKRNGRGFKIYKLRGLKKEAGLPAPSKVLQDQDHISKLLIDF